VLVVTEDIEDGIVVAREAEHLEGALHRVDQPDVRDLGAPVAEEFLASVVSLG
jgi:hypothetical protein